MKHFNYFFISVLLLFSISFISCEEDKQGPSLDYFGGDGFINQNATVDTSSVVNFKFRTMSETDTLGYVRITNADSTYWDAYVPSLCKTNYIGIASFKAPRKTGEYNFVFSVYTANPDSVADAKLLISKTILVSTDVASYLNKEYTGNKIYHVMSQSGKGSFDLVSNMAKDSTANDSTKDMTQSSLHKVGSAWIPGWQINRSNETKFVKLGTNNALYTNPTQRAVKTAFDAGIALSFVPSVVANDVLVVKLRGKEEYAVMKVTAVSSTDASPSTDTSKGSITFSYKKKP
jgi:hypothetical protein